MSIILMIIVVLVFLLLFTFYGLRKQEEYNEKKVITTGSVGSELYDYYLDIIEYVTTGYYDEAKKLLKEVVEKNPDEYPAYLLLSYILRRQNNPEKALSIDKTIYANETLSNRGKKAILKSLLIDYVESGMYKTALKTIENKDKSFKNDFFILELSKDVSYKLGNYEKALEYNKMLLDLKNIKDKSEIGYIAADMAYEALEKGKIKVAEQLIKKGKKYNKDCERLYLVSAEIEYKKNNFSKAKKKIKDALSINIDIIDYIDNLILKIYKNNYDEIIDDFSRLLKNNLHNPYIHIFMSRIYKENNNIDEAIEELHEAILYKPESHYILLLMLDMYIEKGDWDKVVEIKDELKELESDRKYECKKCGSIYHSPTWYCDECKSWGEVVVKL